MAPDDNTTSTTGARPGEPRSFGNGRYVVQHRLGAGNFATVYLAHDERLDIAVAIKLLSDRWSWEPEARGRFVQEARMLRAINDPRVVQIRDIAETDDGRPYLVMDYAERGTLERRLTEVAQRAEVPTATDVRTVARHLAEALRALHARRIAHRDVKPSNLLIAVVPPGATLGPPGIVMRPDEILLLGDLGLAKDLTAGSGLTVGAGTAGYMAPEQSRPGSAVDTRTDIYAASALLAEVASGTPPDPVRRYSDGRLTGGTPLPEGIHEPLRGVLARALDIDPAKRPETIGDWRREVEAALDAMAPGRPVTATYAPPLPVPAAGPTPSIIPVPSTTPAPSITGPAASPAGPTPSITGPTPSSAPTPSSGLRPPGGPKRRARLAAVGAMAVLAAGTVAIAAAGGGGDGGDDTVATTSGTTSGTTSSAPAVSTTVAPPTTATGGPATPVPKTVAPATTAAASTAAPATTAAPEPTAAPPTDPPVTEPPDPAPTVRLLGPTTIAIGQEAAWTVEASADAVRGTWALTGPVQPGDANWFPGNWFRGTWNIAATVTLTLTVYDEAGQSASDSLVIAIQ